MYKRHMCVSKYAATKYNFSLKVKEHNVYPRLHVHMYVFIIFG